MRDPSDGPEPGSLGLSDVGQSCDVHQPVSDPLPFPGHVVHAFPALEFLYDILREQRRRLVAPLRADEVAHAVLHVGRLGENHNSVLRKVVDDVLNEWEGRQKARESSASD